jgi:hypothetical protein
MSPIECAFESDVLLMISTGRWPDRVPEELRTHADGCDVCRELAVAARAIDAVHADSGSVPSLPSAGTVWWRAQIRARQDAVKEVARPITIAQAIGFAVCVGIAGAVFGATAGWFQNALSRASAFVSATFASWQWPALGLDLSALAPYSTAIVLFAAGAVAMMAVLAWAFREDS